MVPERFEIHPCVPSGMNTTPRPSQGGGHTTHKGSEGPPLAWEKGLPAYTAWRLAGKCEKQDWAEKGGCPESYRRPQVPTSRSLWSRLNQGHRVRPMSPLTGCGLSPGRGVALREAAGTRQEAGPPARSAVATPRGWEGAHWSHGAWWHPAIPTTEGVQKSERICTEPGKAKALSV